MSRRVFARSLSVPIAGALLLFSVPCTSAQTAEAEMVNADAPQSPIVTPLKWESVR